MVWLVFVLEFGLAVLRDWSEALKLPVLAFLLFLSQQLIDLQQKTCQRHLPPIPDFIDHHGFRMESRWSYVCFSIILALSATLIDLATTATLQSLPASSADHSRMTRDYKPRNEGKWILDLPNGRYVNID